MTLKRCSLVVLAGCAALASAQQGIGDPSFPGLGNKGYHAEHYDLKLSYVPDTNALKSDVTMAAVADEALATFQLDFTGFQISAVKLNGTAVSFSRTADKLTIKPATVIAKGAGFKLETIYSGNPGLAQSAVLPPGMKSGWVKYPGGAVAVCEPELAHTWYPCNDHPRNKATFDIDVTTPLGTMAVANGRELRISPNHVHFVLDKPGSTCMALVAFGKFGVIKETGPKGISLVNYVPAGEETLYAKRVAINAKFMEYLGSKIGDYPYSTYGVLILPDSISKVNMLMANAALETTALSVFGPKVVNPGTLCHELTHQWMGNCVSVTNWGDDLWWVEGFAQYGDWLQTEMAEGKASYDDLALSTFKQAASSPQWLKPGHVSVADLFSERTYIGGALTFYALRRKIGDEKFFATIRQFIADHKFSSATTQDLIDAACKVSGEDLKPFFKEWLFSDTLPKMPQ